MVKIKNVAEAASVSMALYHGRQRHGGFMQALRDHNIQPATDLIKLASPRGEDRFNATMKLLKMQGQPDAFLTNNSLLAACSAGDSRM